MKHLKTTMLRVTMNLCLTASQNPIVCLTPVQAEAAAAFQVVAVVVDLAAAEAVHRAEAVVDVADNYLTQ